MSEDRNILNFIRSLCADGESGRLEILAGAIQGELSFAEGKLVDARFGHLTGFPAVNAVAAMRDARFSFDPSFAPLGSSSITASERVVLKQFFGIETAATSEYIEPAAVNWPEDVSAATTVASTPVTSAPVAADEVTIVSDVTNAPSAEVPMPVPPPSRFSHRTALAFAAVAIAVLAAVAVLIYRSRSAPIVVAGTATSSSSQATPEKQAEAVAVNSTPTESAPAPAPVKKSEAIASNTTPAHSVSAPAADKRDVKPVKTSGNLSGKWNIVNTVETTEYKSFKNLKLGFDLSINQNGSTFTGSGLKVSENGRTLPANSRTPIKVKGTINGDRIEATFFEDGLERRTNGRFVWRIDNGGRGLKGTFATTAARSRGTSAAIRM